MGKIPKLAAEWKLIHEFKPTEYFPAFDCIVDTKIDGAIRAIAIVLDLSMVALVAEDNLLPNSTLVLRGRLPAVGEWTRIEVSHEEEDGKFFLSLSVGEAEVVKEEVTDPNLGNLSRVRIGVADVCFFLTMRCFNDAMFSNS